MRTNRPRRTKCSKMRGKKSDPHLNPSDPPRRRANKRKGRGTYANDRPPIIGTVGRQSGQVRLRVAHHTNIATLSAHVHQFTQEGATVYTDEWQGYCGLNRPHPTVCHSKRQWATDADGDGFERFTPTPLKAFGPRFATSYARFGGFTRSGLPGTLPYVSFALTAKSSRRSLSQNSSLALNLNMSQRNSWLVNLSYTTDELGGWDYTIQGGLEFRPSDRWEFRSLPVIRVL